MAKTERRKGAAGSRPVTEKPAPGWKAGTAERSRKFEMGDRVTVNAKAPAGYKGREGFITELGPGKSEYRIEFDDTRRPTTGYLLSSWLTAEP